MSKSKFILLIIFYFFIFSSSSQSSSDDLVNKISKNIRCLICQGQSVYDSNSEFAESIKLLIKKKIDEGVSENDIYEYLKIQYGDWIVYEPEFNKNTFFLWTIPIFVFVIGGWVIFRKIKFFKL
tara:strand:- start:764 stop:1135 length:372 start_codon:yes stop_codon:yes gene_type:complete